MGTKIYRRGKSWNHKSWHFCRTCPRWPSSDYEETRYDPWHSVCRECKRIEEQGRCVSGVRWF